MLCINKIFLWKVFYVSKYGKNIKTPVYFSEWQMICRKVYVLAV